MVKLAIKWTEKTQSFYFFEKNSLTRVFLNPIQNGVAAKIAQLGVAQLRGTTVVADPSEFQIFLRPCKEENGISEQQAQYARKSTKPNHEIKPFPLLFFSWKSTCCGGQWMLVSSPLLFLICWRPSSPDYEWFGNPKLLLGLVVIVCKI